jgi:hypothetical protein
MRGGDARLWIFVALVLVVVAFLIYATVSSGGLQ